MEQFIAQLAAERFSPFPRGCIMAITVARRLNADDVLATLTELFAKHRPPAFIRSDNDGEFTAGVVRDWLKRLQVKTLYIEPGLAAELFDYREYFQWPPIRCALCSEISRPRQISPTR